MRRTSRSPARPGTDGVEATRRLRAAHPAARVVILTTFDDETYVFEGLRAGALGYLLKELSGQELAGAIRTVMAGGALIEPSVARKVFAEFARLAVSSRPVISGLTEPLTEREKDVLAGVAAGLSNREMGQKLFLTEGTVKNYVTSVLQKIEARDRTQAALWAKEMGLL